MRLATHTRYEVLAYMRTRPGLCDACYCYARLTSPKEGEAGLGVALARTLLPVGTMDGPPPPYTSI